MNDKKAIEVMLVFHRPEELSLYTSEEFGGELYFCTTAKIAIDTAPEWVARGHPVVILPIAAEVLPLLRGQKVALESL